MKKPTNKTQLAASRVVLRDAVLRLALIESLSACHIASVECDTSFAPNGVKRVRLTVDIVTDAELPLALRSL